MKQIIPVEIQIGKADLRLPFDGTVVDVVMIGPKPMLLCEVNPITLDTGKQVTWVIHAAPPGVHLPSKAEYVGTIMAQAPDQEPVPLFVYAERQPLVLPGQVEERECGGS